MVMPGKNCPKWGEGTIKPNVFIKIQYPTQKSDHTGILFYEIINIMLYFKTMIKYQDFIN